MPDTFTTALALRKPANNDPNWDALLNANFDLLDALAALGSLAVATVAVPSTTLAVKVSAGKFFASDGSVVSYAGASSQALTASATNYLYLTNAGTLTVNTTGFPADTFQVRLAIATTDATKVTALADARAFAFSAGKLRPASASQAAAAALTSATLTNSTTGTPSTTIGDVGAAFSQTGLNNIHASLATQINALRVDLGAVRTLTNQIRADLVTLDVIKGSA